jgi:hypothetical protein
MKNEPEKIYLQVGDIDVPDKFEFVDFDDVTWCTSRQFESDIEYIHSDKVSSMIRDKDAHITKLIAKLNKALSDD